MRFDVSTNDIKFPIADTDSSANVFTLLYNVDVTVTKSGHELKLKTELNSEQFVIHILLKVATIEWAKAGVGIEVSTPTPFC